MCGIAGILNLENGKPARPELLEPMLRKIFHRGPDEDGTLVDGELAMGMRRLSIIDLADGKQPIQNEDGRFSVVFNGEIYNYIELRDDLKKRGHVFRTNSDTEVIVHLFEEHGAECVHKLRGMFGFAVWDHQKHELYIYRDRLGIKPLYYSTQNGTLAFGSEVKSLLTLPWIKAEIDHAGLNEFLSLKYVPAPQTLFKNIASLPPGHMISVIDGKIETKQYWEVSFAEKLSFANEADAVDQLLEKLRESVRLRLRADVPFGAFLSGGLDSSIIVALMSEQLDMPVNTFSAGFAGTDGQDELPYARQVAKKFGCNHHEVLVGAEHFLGHANKVMWHLEMPIADQATVATHMVAELARKHVKMVLTGEGGDELFAGYARYVGETHAKKFAWLPSPLASLARTVTGKLPGLRRQKIAMHALMQSGEAARFSNWFPLFNGDMKRRVVADHLKSTSTNVVNSFEKYLRACDASSPIERMLFVDTKTWLPDYLLLRGDKLTMANSIEGRVPLLDHEVVEFAAKLPPHYKLNGSTRKYLLKKVAARLLPDEIINRKKQGFPIPIERWLRGEANPMMRDLLSPAMVSQRNLFDNSVVQQLLKQHESGYADRSTELWGLMSIELWHQQFVDANHHAPTTNTSCALPTGGLL
jgi:asparagine synthase (glutamine-hydrolysing)